jgi:hypothetical protein
MQLTVPKIVAGTQAMTDVKSIFRKRQFICLLAVLVALVVSDGLISQFLIRGGLGSEGNPFLLNWVTEPNFLSIKIAGALICALILWDIYKHWSKIAIIAGSVFVMLYTGILFWNITVFFISQT